MTVISCQQFTEMAPDVALGLLSGGERAQALDHLARCPTCRDHLEGLIRLADSLLLLAPLGEPPIGFETRVMDRLASEGAFSKPAVAAAHPVDPPPPPGDPQLDLPAARRARHHWALPRAAVAAVAAVVVVVAGVAGMVAGRTTAPRLSVAAQGARTIQAVQVRADDNSGTCRLVAFAASGGRPAELVIHLDESGEPASSYTVVADRTTGGPEVPLGIIAVRNGQGSLDVTLPAGSGPINRVQIVDSGRVHYQAAFAPV